MRILSLLTLGLCIAGCSVSPVADKSYRLAKTISLPGDGGWDYLTVDEASRNVYISHATEVDVLDADTGRMKGKIPGNGIHGIALAPDSGRGFISNGKSDTITVFDLNTLEVLSEVKAGKKPDAIMYDPSTRRVFAFNGESKNATVINASTGKVAGSITLGGAPEFAVADGLGYVFVNLEDKNELVKINARTLRVAKRWSLAPGSAPSSMAMDTKNRRLFIGCGNQLLLVVNADNGQIVTALPIGDHVDATAFDPETKLVIASNGEGTLSIIRQLSADAYKAEDNVKTRARSKTFALDSKTHTLFIPAAAFGAAPAAATADNPKRRPPMIPGSFAVLVRTGTVKNIESV